MKQRRRVVRAGLTGACALLMAAMLVACSGGGSSQGDSGGRATGSGGSATSSSGGAVDAVNVVEVLTAVPSDAYAILSEVPNIAKPDVIDRRGVDEGLMFSTNQKYIDALHLEYEAEGADEEFSWKHLKDDPEYQEYRDLVQQLSSETQFWCAFYDGKTDEELTRKNFKSDFSLKLSDAECAFLIPASEELDCEAIASYVKAATPFEQCYVVQVDSDKFEGGAKGGGCVTEIDVYKSSPYRGSDAEEWVISMRARSISRSSSGESHSSSFDREFKSLNAANYMDSYIAG